MKYCIKITTFDKRQFYLDSKDFSKVIKHKGIVFESLRKVKFNNQKVLDLKDIARAISDHTFTYSKNKNNDNLSEDIKNYILKSFEQKNFLNFNGLKQRFKDYDVTTSNLYNYLNNIKKIYKKRGREIKRIKSGVFKLF